MKPVDFRNETWAQLQGRLSGMRARTYRAWIEFEAANHAGGGTTRAVSEWARLSLLTFRPRTTELFQMGALRLADDQFLSTGEGRYVARTADEWQAWFLQASQPMVQALLL